LNTARRLVRFVAPMALSFAAVVAFAPAAGAQGCPEAARCCAAVMAGLHQAPTSCAQLAAAPARACPAMRAQFILLAQRAGQAVPAACGAAGPPAGDAPVPPPANPAGDVSASAAPPPLPPDTAAHEGSAGRVTCTLRNVGGHRVLLADTTSNFELYCTGTAAAAGPPALLRSLATYDGRPVNVTFARTPGVGIFENVFAGLSRYRAPERFTPAQADVVISATVIVGDVRGAHDEIHVARTVHLVPRRLRLDANVRRTSRCSSPGSQIAAFDAVCNQGIDLEVGADFAVRSGAGSSCGHGTWQGLQSCAAGLHVSVPNATWSLDAARGSIDPETGVMTLQVQGNRLDLPDLSGAAPAHTVALFPRPLTIRPDDGAARSFGSLTAIPNVGAVTAFAVHAR
jgi:hypothetical protein